VEEAAGGSPSDAAARGAGVSLQRARQAAEVALEVFQYKKVDGVPPKVSLSIQRLIKWLNEMQAGGSPRC
jgi:hypothetical protein